jgi:hypothetical protein
MYYTKLAGGALVCIAAISLAVGQTREDDKQEKDDCFQTTKDNHDRKQDREDEDMDSLPCGCPLWRVLSLGSNNYIYHAEYFEESCEEEPLIISMYGDLELSEDCDDEHCISPEKRKRRVRGKQQGECKGSKFFPGMADYISNSYEHDLPVTDDDTGDLDHSTPIQPPVRFIKFQPNPRLSIHQNPRYAKVFGFKLNYATRYEDETLRTENIYVAMEVRHLPVGAFAPFVPCERLESGPPVGECHVFRATLRETDSPTQILLLTPDSSPW